MPGPPTTLSTCCSRAPPAHRPGDLGRAGRGRRRAERVHRQGVHVLLRAGARRRSAARHRRPVRHGDQLADRAEGRGRRTGGDPGRDRHERRRSLRHRARGFRGPAVRRHPARPSHPGHGRVDQLDHTRADHRAITAPGTRRRAWWWPPRAASARRGRRRRPRGVRRRGGHGGGAGPRASAAWGKRCPAVRAAACGWCRGASSRRTWSSGARGCPATTTAGSRSACSTPPSAAGCPPGCSRRSGRSAGWPTRCTASRRSMPKPACGGCTWAACPPRPTRSSPSARRRSPRPSPPG